MFKIAFFTLLAFWISSGLFVAYAIAIAKKAPDLVDRADEEGN